MQVCFQNLPGDRDPAQQPRGTRSSLAVKVCHEGCPQKPRAMFPWQQWAWPGPTEALSTQQHHTHLPTGYSWFICEPVPGRTAGPSTAHSWDAQQVPVCLLHLGLYFCRTQHPQVGRPGCTMQEEKEFTLQLKGCLQNSILPQPLPKTTRVKRIYITKLPSSLIFILFLTCSNFTYLLQPRNCLRHYPCLSPSVYSTVHKILSFHMNSS